MTYLYQSKEAVWDFKSTEVIIGVRRKPARPDLDLTPEHKVSR